MSDTSGQQRLFVQAGIGFFSILLIILLIALIGRFAIPRIEASRSSDDTTLISNVIQIEVLNGCGVSGVATDVTRSLRSFGFDVVQMGNFDHFEVDRTMVISRNGDMESARKVARALGVGEDRILREESPDFYLDLTLLIGADYETLNL